MRGVKILRAVLEEVDEASSGMTSTVMKDLESNLLRLSIVVCRRSSVPARFIV
jgi:hypothetical protein